MGARDGIRDGASIPVRSARDLAAWRDEDLARLVASERGRARGAAAARELFGRYRRTVFAWSYRFLRDREQALDVAQDALLQAYRGLDAYRADAPFGAWLFAIVRNRCRSVTRPRILVRDPGVEPDALHAASDPSDEALRRVGAERVLEVMRRVLTPREQEALWLQAMEGMSVEHVTRVLKLEGRSGARAVLQTARRKVREALGLGARPAEEEA